ncbi:VOC family protein [Nocardioides kribbensis]|uniref:VOC family protein n=1 Tax=Nocardioides kribbensis TaxID=305517 RepID=A0ABV1P3K4_9ACTN
MSPAGAGEPRAGDPCVDPGRVARWWADVLGAEAVHDEGGWWTVAGVAADERMTLDFNAVPEPRTVPHRVHWDVSGDVEALLAAGAHRRWETEHWSVLGDPEGNEFCVFAPES